MKTYLGDAVYVEFDGFGLKLTTEDGIRATNTIYLEPGVYEALVTWVKGLSNGQVATADAEVPQQVDQDSGDKSHIEADGYEEDGAKPGSQPGVGNGPLLVRTCRDGCGFEWTCLISSNS